jgi:hypothetical protein
MRRVGRKRGRAIRLALLFPLLIPAVVGAQANPKAILGTWRGTSTCVDKVTFPACNDEEVIYQVTAIDNSDSVTVHAEKIVKGKREAMGDNIFGPESGGTWVSRFPMGRYTGVITLTVRGDEIEGDLVQQMRGRVRRISLQREKS